MYQPTTRLLAVLELLQAHARISGAEIAARLGVELRTVRRYIATLEGMGIPVTAERGRYGGYALMPGFKLPPMMFTDDEALALAVGLLAARSLGLGQAAPAVTSAQAKLERMMPSALKLRVRAVDEMVQLDMRKPASPADNGVLAVLSAAAQARRRVALRYRVENGSETAREFDTYGLAYHGGSWYAVGWCHLRGALRSFRLDRIVQVSPVDRSFARPPDFDPLGYLVESVARLARAHAVQVLLKTDLQTARDHLFYGAGVFEPVEGGTLLHNQSDDLDWFARQLARLPFPFEIRSPDLLRDALRACAERLLGLAGKTNEDRPQAVSSDKRMDNQTL
ncbi:helix-turn-helix transcriptional regulator [Massilia horti]|uniref:YafY family transcriptional regulator n=1 Tax=Massilia horti TaxID=2562153 RepID=A0A4Y9SWN7_9BURK|nr:YafY family protein [Massilia horti]TFW29156.1 YafY family transcriptional regulator [Massilia horti]